MAATYDAEPGRYGSVRLHDNLPVLPQPTVPIVTNLYPLLQEQPGMHIAPVAQTLKVPLRCSACSAANASVCDHERWGMETSAEVVERVMAHSAMMSVILRVLETPREPWDTSLLVFKIAGSSSQLMAVSLPDELFALCKVTRYSQLKGVQKKQVQSLINGRAVTQSDVGIMFTGLPKGNILIFAQIPLELRAHIGT